MGALFSFACLSRLRQSTAHLARLVSRAAEAQRAAAAASIEGLGAAKTEAIESERYEDAAALRDRQKALQVRAHTGQQALLPPHIGLAAGPLTVAPWARRRRRRQAAAETGCPVGAAAAAAIAGGAAAGGAGLSWGWRVDNKYFAADVEIAAIQAGPDGDEAWVESLTAALAEPGGEGGGGGEPEPAAVDDGGPMAARDDVGADEEGQDGEDAAVGLHGGVRLADAETATMLRRPHPSGCTGTGHTVCSQVQAGGRCQAVIVVVAAVR